MKEKETEATLVVFTCEIGSKTVNSVMDAAISYLGKRMVLEDGRKDKLPFLATRELTPEDKKHIASLDDTVYPIFIGMAKETVNRNYVDALEITEED